MMNIKEVLLLWFTIFLIKSLLVELYEIKDIQMNVTNLLFKKRRIYASLKYNIWGVDLEDIQV